jgi:hypothetical protein
VLGEERADPPSRTTKKIINNEAYEITNLKLPSLEWQLKA